MRISNPTLSVLKNFAAINKSIWIEPGNVLTTISPVDGAITAVATVEDEFPSALGIYEISSFLNALTVFDPEKYDMELNSNHVHVKEGGKELKYQFCSKKVIAHTPPEDMEIEFPDTEIEFGLPGKIFQEALKVLRILQMDSVSIIGDGHKIYLKVVTPKDPTSNSYSVEVGETTKVFNLIFKGDIIEKLMDGDYKVSIAEGLARFVTSKITYYVAPDATSAYN